MPTRRSFFAVVAGLVPAVGPKATWTNPLSWFKPLKPEHKTEIVILRFLKCAKNRLPEQGEAILLGA